MFSGERESKTLTVTVTTIWLPRKKKAENLIFACSLFCLRIFNVFSLEISFHGVDDLCRKGVNKNTLEVFESDLQEKLRIYSYQ